MACRVQNHIERSIFCHWVSWMNDDQRVHLWCFVSPLLPHSMTERFRLSIIKDLAT